MSVEIDSNISGVAEANAELDRLIAADAVVGADTAGTATGKSATEGQRAAQTESNKSARDQVQPSNDTPSDADLKDKSTVQSLGPKVEDPKAKAAEAEAGKSRYAKARERQDKSWEAINAEKAAMKAEREKLEGERKEFDGKRKASEEQFSPEQYDKASEQFEADGKFDLAELAKKKAAELRKNPPAKVADEAKARTEAARKEWTLKAGVDFPDLSKDKSALNLRVQEMFREEPDLQAHPKGIYLAARLASLESAAAGVPKLEKELVQLRAKVTEYERLTAPGGEQTVTALPSAKAFEQKSSDEQFQELVQQATEMGTIR